MTTYNKACVLNIGHPTTEEKRKTISEQRQKRSNLVQELERQKKIKQIQDMVREDLMVVVNTDRLPQALKETKTEMQSMLNSNTVKAQFYEQMLTLNGQQSQCKSQVSSREQLKVMDVIHDPYTVKKSAKQNLGLSQNSTKPGSVLKAESGTKSAFARRASPAMEEIRVKTPMSAHTHEQINTLHQMHSRLKNASKNKKDQAAQSENTTPLKDQVEQRHTAQPRSRTRTEHQTKAANSEQQYPWEMRKLDPQAAELQKMVKNY